MISGGGVQNKVLESMGAGARVIVSPLAARHFLAVKKNPPFLIAKQSKDYLEMIKMKRKKDIDRKSFNYIKKFHSLKVLEKGLINAVKSLNKKT